MLGRFDAWLETSYIPLWAVLLVFLAWLCWRFWRDMRVLRELRDADPYE